MGLVKIGVCFWVWQNAGDTALATPPGSRPGTFLPCCQHAKGATFTNVPFTIIIVPGCRFRNVRSIRLLDVLKTENLTERKPRREWKIIPKPAERKGGGRGRERGAGSPTCSFCC